MLWNACTADELDVSLRRFNPAAVQARHLRASLSFCVHLRFPFLLPEQARNRRRGTS
jgi:hypothetical protein